MPASSTMGRTTTATLEVEPTTLQIDPSHSTAEVAVRHLMVTTVNAITRAFVVCLTIRSRGRLIGRRGGRAAIRSSAGPSD